MRGFNLTCDSLWSHRPIWQRFETSTLLFCFAKMKNQPLYILFLLSLNEYIIYYARCTRCSDEWFLARCLNWLEWQALHVLVLFDWFGAFFSASSAAWNFIQENKHRVYKAEEIAMNPSIKTSSTTFKQLARTYSAEHCAWKLEHQNYMKMN